MATRKKVLTEKEKEALEKKRLRDKRYKERRKKILEIEKLEKEGQEKKEKLVLESPYFDQIEKGNLSFNQVLYLEVYNKTLMNGVHAAEVVGVSRQAVAKWKINNKFFFECLKLIDEGYVELARSKLTEKALAGDTKALMYILNNKGQDLGYGITNGGDKIGTQINVVGFEYVPAEKKEDVIEVEQIESKEETIEDKFSELEGE